MITAGRRDTLICAKKPLAFGSRVGVDLSCIVGASTSKALARCVSYGSLLEFRLTPWGGTAPSGLCAPHFKAPHIKQFRAKMHKDCGTMAPISTAKCHAEGGPLDRSSRRPGR